MSERLPAARGRAAYIVRGRPAGATTRAERASFALRHDPGLGNVFAFVAASGDGPPAPYSSLGATPQDRVAAGAGMGRVGATPPCEHLFGRRV